MLLGVGFVKIAANVFFCREFIPKDSIIFDTSQADPKILRFNSPVAARSASVRAWQDQEDQNLPNLGNVPDLVIGFSIRCGPGSPAPTLGLSYEIRQNVVNVDPSEPNGVQGVAGSNPAVPKCGRCISCRRLLTWREWDLSKATLDGLSGSGLAEATLANTIASGVNLYILGLIPPSRRRYAKKS